MVNTRGVLRTQLNIYDGAFLPKLLMNFSRQLFLSKNSIVDFRLVSKYASEYNNNIFPDVSKIELMTF